MWIIFLHLKNSSESQSYRTCKQRLQSRHKCRDQIWLTVKSRCKRTFKHVEKKLESGIDTCSVNPASEWSRFKLWLRSVSLFHSQKLTLNHHCSHCVTVSLTTTTVGLLPANTPTYDANLESSDLMLGAWTEHPQVQLLNSCQGLFHMLCWLMCVCASRLHHHQPANASLPCAYCDNTPKTDLS